MTRNEPSSSPSLSGDQRELLQALVDCYGDDRHPVKRERLAEVVDCHPVTVSVRMQNLRARQLVKSTSGPRGGYEPTLKARDTLANRDTELSVDVPITSDGEQVDGVGVRGLALLDLHAPRRSRGRLSLDGPITAFALGDSVSIGPLSGSNLHVEGIVEKRDATTGVIVLAIDAMRTVAEDSTATSRNEGAKRT